MREGGREVGRWAEESINMTTLFLFVFLLPVCLTFIINKLLS